MRQGPEPRTSPCSVAPLRPGVTPSRPWAWPGATGGRRGGGGDRWRAAGPEPGQAMAASERLYELWLLYYAQVSPSRPWSAGSPDPRAQCLLHLRPAPPGPQIGARTRGTSAPRTRASPWLPGCPTASGICAGGQCSRVSKICIANPQRDLAASVDLAKSLSSHPFQNWVN